MKQQVISENVCDENGNPAGGRVTGVGIAIQWQDGPLGKGPGRKEPNGAFVEGVIQAAVERLDFYEASRFSCEENRIAITHLKDALAALESRTVSREARGAEGTHEV